MQHVAYGSIATDPFSTITVDHWRGSTMDHEWLFWDNQGFLKQIGL